MVIKKSWMTGIASLGIFAVGLAGCEKPPAGPASAMPPPLVTVAPAVVRDVPEYLDEIGKSAAPEVVSVQPQVGGKIIQIAFTDGADIKKGDLLFAIDPRPYQAVLDQAVALLAQNQADLELAKAQFHRAQEMLGSKVISPDDFDTRKSAVGIAEAKIEADKAAIEAAQINLDYCIIRAPINGRAGQKLVDMGNVVIANNPQANTSLLVIQNLDPIYAEFTIPESELAQVRQRMADGSLTTLVRLPSEAEFTRKGTLTFLDNAVQDATGTVKLRATLPNVDRHFWPGQFVNVRLVIKVLKNAVLIPNQSVQISQKGPFVYVVGSDGTAQARPVVPGQRQGDLVVVESGVAVGEQVIVTGQLLVFPGGKVTVQPPASPPATQATTATDGANDGQKPGGKS